MRQYVLHAHEEAHLGHRATRQAHPPWPLRSMLRAIWEIVPEARAAHRRYEDLVSKGVPHNTALRTALGVMPDPDCAPPQERAGPGRASRLAAKSLS